MTSDNSVADYNIERAKKPKTEPTGDNCLECGGKECIDTDSDGIHKSIFFVLIVGPNTGIGYQSELLRSLKPRRTQPTA